MEAIRSFIAIELPEDIRNRIGEVMRQLQARILAAGGESARRCVRWSPPENIHITLKFLGDVSSDNMQSLANALKTLVAGYAPFQVQIEGIGAFPNPRRPRVLWVGSQVPEVMAALQQAIEVQTRALGYPGEERPFSPHLTLGRVSQNASQAEVAAVSQALGGMQVGKLGVVSVREIHLYRSDLRPGGSVYTSLYTFTLEKVV